MLRKKNHPSTTSEMLLNSNVSRIAMDITGRDTQQTAIPSLGGELG
jgi:hypothetical protein